MDTLFHSFLFRRIISKGESDCIDLLIKMCDFFCWNTRSFRFKYKETACTDELIEVEITFSIEVTERNANTLIASLFAFAASVKLLFLGQHAVTLKEL